LNSNDLVKIENILNVSLPVFYKQVMVNYPLEGFKYVRKYLINDPEEVIEINQKFRRDGFQKKLWPNNFFVIGFNSEKSFNFIDVNEQEEAAFSINDEDKFNPKNISRLKVALNFKRFVDACKEMEQFITMGKQNNRPT
jgi:hypothetical protein